MRAARPSVWPSRPATFPVNLASLPPPQEKTMSSANPAPSQAQASHMAIGFILIAQRKQSNPKFIAMSAAKTASKALPPQTAPAVLQAIQEITQAMNEAWVASGQSNEREWDTL